METEETFEVRDLREKNRFFLDDQFFNGYVHIFGTNALGIYCSLCRHADKQQKSFPSQKTIAKELNLSEPTVNEWLKVLEFFKIIKKIRIGKQCTNRYYLLSKKIWRKDFDVILNYLSSGDIKLFKFTTKTVLVHGLNGLSSNRKETQEEGNTKERNTMSSQVFLERWNKKMPFKAVGLSSKRKEHLATRLKEPLFVEKFEEIMERILASDFLLGKKPTEKHPNFKADFSWIIKNNENYLKVLEGKYKNTKTYFFQTRR